MTSEKAKICCPLCKKVTVNFVRHVGCSHREMSIQERLVKQLQKELREQDTVSQQEEMTTEEKDLQPPEETSQKLQSESPSIENEDFPECPLCHKTGIDKLRKHLRKAHEMEKHAAKELSKKILKCQ